MANELMSGPLLHLLGIVVICHVIFHVNDRNPSLNLKHDTFFMLSP